MKDKSQKLHAGRGNKDTLEGIGLVFFGGGRVQGLGFTGLRSRVWDFGFYYRV